MTTEPTPLTPETIAPILESLLFVADHPVSVSELATTLEVSASQINKGLDLLDEQLRSGHLRLQRLGKRLQLVTDPAVTEYIERFLGLSFSSKLSAAALEALGIIAYKQPVTRAEIEAVRGVGSDGVLRTLLSKGLVEEVGRLDTVGHPIQYGTTFEFLTYFGLTSLADLPELAMEEAGADGEMLALLANESASE